MDTPNNKWISDWKCGVDTTREKELGKAFVATCIRLILRLQQTTSTTTERGMMTSTKQLPMKVNCAAWASFCAIVLFLKKIKQKQRLRYDENVQSNFFKLINR